MNKRAAELIADRLPKGLVVPASEDGKTPAKALPLPGLSNLGMTPEQVADFADEAGLSNDVPELIGEAIVALLETEGGFELVPREQWEALKADTKTLDEVDPAAPSVAIHCGGCGNQLMDVVLGRAKVRVDGRLLAQQIETVCKCLG